MRAREIFIPLNFKQQRYCYKRTAVGAKPADLRTESLNTVITRKRSQVGGLLSSVAVERIAM